MPPIIQKRNNPIKLPIGKIGLELLEFVFMGNTPPYFYRQDRFVEEKPRSWLITKYETTRLFKKLKVDNWYDALLRCMDEGILKFPPYI